MIGERSVCEKVPAGVQPERYMIDDGVGPGGEWEWVGRASGADTLNGSLCVIQAVDWRRTDSWDDRGGGRGMPWSSIGGADGSVVGGGMAE